MFTPQTVARAPVVRCDQAPSVLDAIEARWVAHHAGTRGIVLGLYAYFAHLLAEEGFIVDTIDGLEILEHCRRRNLPIVDILYALEDRIRDAGFSGQRLGLADFKSGERQVYVFYDPSRFRTFEELKQKVARRISLVAPQNPQPSP